MDFFILKNKLLQTGAFIENEYLDKYCNLIIKNLLRSKEKYKTQEHHIIPRYFYKEKNLDINNSKDNLINVFHKDHALLHYYLCFCSVPKYRYSNELAIKHILNNSSFKQLSNWKEESDFIKNLDRYQELIEDEKINCGNKHRGKIISQETKEKERMSHLGRKYNKMSDIGRQNISKAKKGCTHIVYEETKKKISEKRKNKKLINISKGNLKKSVSQLEVDKYYQEGWVKGWGNPPCLGRIGIYKDKEYRVIKKEDLSFYKQEGWKKGRYISPEIKEKMAEGLKNNSFTKNTIWVNNGIINKRVSKDNIPEGFIIGRTKWKQ